jgi:hypothetical protein
MDPDPEDVAFLRLHALVRHGYVAKLGRQRPVSADDTIELVHPRMVAKKRRAPRLTLYPTGDLHGDHQFIAGDDPKGFRDFLKTIPFPSFYDRHLRHWTLRGQVILIWYVAMLVLAYALDWLLAVAFGSTNSSPWLMALVATAGPAIAAISIPKDA